jgi:hypothetical protein
LRYSHHDSGICIARKLGGSVVTRLVPLFLRYSAIGQVAGKEYKRLRGIRNEDEEYEENKEGKTEEDKA